VGGRGDIGADGAGEPLTGGCQMLETQFPHRGKKKWVSPRRGGLPLGRGCPSGGTLGGEKRRVNGNVHVVGVDVNSYFWERGECVEGGGGWETHILGWGGVANHEKGGGAAMYQNWGMGEKDKHGGGVSSSSKRGDGQGREKNWGERVGGVEPGCWVGDSQKKRLEERRRFSKPCVWVKTLSEKREQ